jgi:hypothetical protein
MWMNINIAHVPEHVHKHENMDVDINIYMNMIMNMNMKITRFIALKLWFNEINSLIAEESRN